MKYVLKEFASYLLILSGVMLILLAIVPYGKIRYGDDMQQVSTFSEMGSSVRFGEKTTRACPVDAGKISQGTVNVKNVGRDIITDITVLSSCSCTNVQLSKTTMSPSESITVYFSIDAKGKSGDIVNTFVFRYTENGRCRFDTFYVTTPVISSNP